MSTMWESIYPSEKSTCFCRSSVMLIAPMAMSALPVCTAGICEAKSITRYSNCQLRRLAHSVMMSISSPDGFPELMKLKGGMAG